MLTNILAILALTYLSANQSTCYASTKVQILPQSAVCARLWPGALSHARGGRKTCAAMRRLRAAGFFLLGRCVLNFLFRTYAQTDALKEK
jgi:hypothetical protein